MLRSVASKLAWVGRTASMVFGLALVMALLFGAATTALAHSGVDTKLFHLGHSNVATALTSLGGKLGVNGPMLAITNNNADTNDTALSLNVQAGEAPMRVNSATKVGNLNSDKVDSYDSTTLLPGGDLPPGRTVRGNFEMGGQAAGAFHRVPGDSISFGYRLASQPTVEFVREGAASTTNCPGTASSPEAAKGYLCIYESDKWNNYEPGNGITYPAYRNPTRVGVGLITYAHSAGYVEARGTWAVTGPDPGITPL